MKFTGPGDYLDELPGGPRSIRGVETSTTAFVGTGAHRPVGGPITCHSWADYVRVCGERTSDDPLGAAVLDFFRNGGDTAIVVQAANIDEGLAALDDIDRFGLLVVPPENSSGTTDPAVIAAAARYCEHRRAILIADAPAHWTVEDAVVSASAGFVEIGTDSPNVALYFPRVRQTNLLTNAIETLPAAGAVAGVIARTDASRGVWSAPAGRDATLRGVVELASDLSDLDATRLGALGVNTLRTIPTVGRVVWGSRTLHGNDALASPWKYVPVRRVTLYIEDSVQQGLQWVVFEPNSERLWAAVRASVEDFLHSLWRQGALKGDRPERAYYVRTGLDTMTQDDIDNGVLNIQIGIAPVKPAEFVIISIRQLLHHDPYKNFRIRVVWGGRAVAGFTAVSGLEQPETVEYREGGSPGAATVPGRTKFAALTLEHGVTHDDDFEDWANSVGRPTDLTIELYDEAGRRAAAYLVASAWVSEFQALPDLDGDASAVRIDHLKLEHSGWTILRDPDD